MHNFALRYRPGILTFDREIELLYLNTLNNRPGNLALSVPAHQRNHAFREDGRLHLP